LAASQAWTSERNESRSDTGDLSEGARAGTEGSAGRRLGGGA